MSVPDDYLGDGVYASFDEEHVWLDLRAQPGPGGHVCKIALEPAVLVELVRFGTRCGVLADRGSA